MEKRGRLHIERINYRGENKSFTVDVSPKARKITGIVITTKLTGDEMPVNRHFFGAAATGGVIDNAFVNALSNEQMESTVKVFEVDATGAGIKVFYARPVRLDGLPSFEIDNQSAPFLDPVVVSVTDAETGYQEDYYVWESQDADLGELELYVY